MNILLVNDDLDLLNLTKIPLASVGHEVTVTTDDKKALKLCLEGGFDLAILGLHMQHQNGIEFTRNVRADASNGEIPIIILTSAPINQSIEEEALAAGVNRFLCRPIPNPQLLHEVSELMPA